MKKAILLVLVVMATALQAQTTNNSASTMAYGSLDGTDVSQTENQLRVTVFPNPTTSSIKIESQSLIVSYTLQNSLGQVLAKKRIIKRRKRKKGEQIDLSMLENGVFFLQIETETGFLLKRIIKK